MPRGTLKAKAIFPRFFCHLYKAQRDIVFAMVAIVSAASGVTLSEASADDAKRRFVQDFVKGEKWLQKEPESMWCYEVVFFDFNDDGREEALACDELDSGSGAYTWSFAYRTTRGDIVSSGRVADGVDMMSQSGKIGFGCPANRLYKVAFDEEERLVGRDVGMSTITKERVRT